MKNMGGGDNIVGNKKILSKKQIMSITLKTSIFLYPIGLVLGFNPLNGLSVFYNLFVGTIVFLFVGGIIRNLVGSNRGQIIGSFYGIIFGCLFGGLFGYISSIISGYFLNGFVILLTIFNFFDINVIYNQSIIGLFDFSGIYSQNAFRSFILIGGTFSGGVVGLIRGSYDGLMAGKDNENKINIVKTYENVDNANKSIKSKNEIAPELSISRETEFYQGYIRLKMSISNLSSLVINDVALDFDYNEDLLRMDVEYQTYGIKNGKIILGNIASTSSTSVVVYFDPMMCSKGTDINCQINYKDAKGQPQTTHMKPKQISVVCPIMETESDINIGRLKEFIEKLPYRDSKVYQIQNGFDIDVLKNISREIVQKHDVKHIRTLFTKDGNTCEIWYYGKTKVHGHDIVIKITILSETKSIELFAATETVESLAGLLAEVGRELKGAIESKVTGNVQQVINVSIKDSIVQRSNLLSHCDIDGNCSGDVVIEDSIVQRSNIGRGESENEGVSKEMDKDKVYNYLVNIVNNRSDIENTKIGYKDVLNYFNRDTKYLPLLFTRLAEICKYNHERNEPLISAIVVNEEPSIPGKGFFENCMRKYRGYIGPSDGPEAQKIHDEELIRVFNYWHNGDEKTCPACGMVVLDGAKFCMECGEKLQ